MSQAEFLSFMLTELDLVSAHEIAKILRLFDALDTDKSGVLTRRDIQLQLKRANDAPRHHARNPEE